MLNNGIVKIALRDLGLSDEYIDTFVELSVIQQQKSLDKLRIDILHKLHKSQDQLECLDYLRYQYKLAPQREENL